MSKRPARTILHAPQAAKPMTLPECATSAAAINFTADMCRVNGGLLSGSTWPADLSAWGDDAIRAFRHAEDARARAQAKRQRRAARRAGR